MGDARRDAGHPRQQRRRRGVLEESTTSDAPLIAATEAYSRRNASA
jgi:hypothetical protein